MTYLPSISVAAPRTVPSTVILTKGNGSPVAASVTKPVNFPDVPAKATDIIRNVNRLNRKKFFIVTPSFKNFNLYLLDFKIRFYMFSTNLCL